MSIFEKMFAIDRRWVYLIIGLAVLISLKIDFSVPIPISAEARNIHGFVDNLKAGDVIHLAMDYDPASMAELQPMTLAILKQCFEKDIKVVFTALHQFGPALGAATLDTAVARHQARSGVRKQNGVDYVFLGYKPYPILIILGMGQNYRIPFPRDYYGTLLDSLPMMANVQNYGSVKAVLNVSGTTATDNWITYGNGRYGVPLAIGVTGVMATEYYQFLQTGQIFGILGGLKGAAEYETLVKTPGPAVDGMKVQLVVHWIIIVFIIIGNIGYFAMRRSARRGHA
jgi:acylphosphatase